MQIIQPDEVMSTLCAAGLEVSLTPDDRLKVSPASSLSDSLRTVIRIYKPILVGYLRQVAANDDANQCQGPNLESDRWCWPHSPAMNSAEVDIFRLRCARFIDVGVTHDAAEQLADKLVIRDRDEDDRHSCLECAHLNGHWRCLSWRRANLIADVLSTDWVLRLYRCPGFVEKRG